MTRHIKCDLCVIGAGAGGLSVAAGAARLGRNVVLIEKGAMGGDCLNYGCVPSKALIAAARRAAAARDGERLGVAADPRIDFAQVMTHVRAAIAAIEPHDSQERFEGLGVTVLREEARFTGARTLEAGEARITAKRIVIATGSKPAIPAVEGLEDLPYLTNETMFALNALPSHLIVLGGGPVGCELAQAFARLGSKVSLVQRSTLLPREDKEAVALVRERMQSDGVEIYENNEALGAGKTPEGISLRLEERTLSGSHLLVAAGRRPNHHGLAPGKAGVAVDEGGILVDNRLRTSNPRAYAIGDAISGALRYTHVAGDHASTVIRNVLFKLPARRREALAPRVTYTSPEIAAIGALPQLAEEEGARIIVQPFISNDRAVAEGETEGFLKLAIDRRGRVRGGVIAGEGAGEMVHCLALAVANGLRASAFTSMIAPYPTKGEIIKRAAGAWYEPKLFSGRARALVRLLALFD